MDRTALVLLVCAALWAAPSAAFFQDLLQEAKQALLHPQPHPQPLPPQYPYQHRRSMYDAPVQQGYASYRPAVYQQWVQPAVQPRPLSYDVGTAYSYGGNNPFSTFWQQQSSWLPQGLPWLSNRQPAQQVQQVQPVQQLQQLQQAPVLQALSAVAPQPPAQLLVQQPQPQPAVQGIWGFLPWTGNSQTAAGAGGSNPVLSFFQNQASLLPWNQQSHQAARPVVFTTPLAPSAGHGVHAAPAAPVSLQLSAQLPVGTPSSASSLSASAGDHEVKPDGLVLDDILPVQSFPDNGVRRIHQDGTPCA